MSKTPKGINIMNKSILHSAITAALVISIAACSSGGSDVAGIGGSGITSSGTITGFGSVYVNGVKFDTSSSTITIDDNPGIESDLATGMRVTVRGTLIDDSNGTATSISFNDDLEGPVSNIQQPPYDTTRTMTVLGRQVVIDSSTTSFDISGALGGPFDFDSIADGNLVEISGFLDSNGVMKATRVELKATIFNHNGTLVEMKGAVDNFSDPTFNLVNTSGVTIDISSAVIDNNLPGGIVDGAFVEVKGTCSSGACATINASKVESGLDDINDNDDVEVEGIVTSLTDQNNFEVNNIPVDASNATRIPASLNIVLNQEVEVEGTISNGTLVATKVKDESNDIKVEATISSVTPSTSSFELSPVSGQSAITVVIDKSTEVNDDVGSITNPDDLINSLSIGEFVSVEGYDGGDGSVIASEIKREAFDPTSDTADIIVQGKLESITKDISITVLGVTFQIDDAGETDFQDTSETNITQDAFIDAAPVGTLVKVKDKDPDTTSDPNGIADEIEIELP
jgi:hypothetical protein